MEIEAGKFIGRDIGTLCALHGGEMSDYVYATLHDDIAGDQPVPAIVDAADLIYARADECGPEVLAFGAWICLLAAEGNWNAMGPPTPTGDALGERMAAKLDRLAKGLVVSDDYPPPSPRFLPEEAPAEPVV